MTTKKFATLLILLTFFSIVNYVFATRGIQIGTRELYPIREAGQPLYFIITFIILPLGVVFFWKVRNFFFKHKIFIYLLNIAVFVIFAAVLFDLFNLIF